MKEKIVVTGIGMVTPLGCGREISWKKIKEGRSLVSEPISNELDSYFSPYIRFSDYVNPNGLPRVFMLALLSAREALKDSALDLTFFNPERLGSTVSVSKPILLETSFIPPEAVAEYLCKELKIQGPSRNIIAACATGIHSLLFARRWLLEGKCDIVIAGSAESALQPLYIAGFKQMGVLSDFPCPFDIRRKGFVMGEGAGIFILERKADALARGAKIYAEILGCEIGADTTHPTAFDSEGSSIARVIQKLVNSCKISGSKVDYINLHGTGTKLNDITETRAIKKVFGKGAYQLALSSTKAATGHLLGASGSVESAIACLAIRDQFIPPTANLEFPDPECDLDYVPKNGKNKKIETAVSLSFGFGGPIGAVVFKKSS